MIERVGRQQPHPPVEPPKECEIRRRGGYAKAPVVHADRDHIVGARAERIGSVEPEAGKAAKAAGMPL